METISLPRWFVTPSICSAACTRKLMFHKQPKLPPRCGIIVTVFQFAAPERYFRAPQARGCGHNCESASSVAIQAIEDDLLAVSAVSVQGHATCGLRSA